MVSGRGEEEERKSEEGGAGWSVGLDRWMGWAEVVAAVRRHRSTAM